MSGQEGQLAIRIVLADDHALLRQGVRSLIENESDMEVIGEANDGREVVSLCKQMCPDLVVMDIGMPHLNGIEATRKIRTEDDSIKVLALSMHDDKRYAAGMLAAGASGYLLKDCVYDELVEGIRKVARGGTYLSPSIQGIILGDYVDRMSDARGEQPSAFSVLTEREREVLQLVAEGRTTKEIAGALYISVKTVETHRQNIMEKTGLHNVAELTKYAIREGLTSTQ